MAQHLTNFTATQHGFKFLNRFELGFPTTLRVPIFGEVDLQSIAYGLCGGMCFGALDYFHAGHPVPGYLWPQDLPFLYEVFLWDRQVDSMIPLTIPKVFEWMMLDDADVAQRCAGPEVTELRRQVDQGVPTVLALVRAKHLDNPVENHQVLAVGYDFDEATQQLKIYLYEPNYPGSTPTLDLNLAQPSAGIRLTQSTGEPLRGFFVIPYRAEPIPGWLG